MSAQFDLRNGAIRKKYDSLKYTLKKMEDTLYQLSLAEAGLKPKTEEEAVRDSPTLESESQPQRLH